MVTWIGHIKQNDLGMELMNEMPAKTTDTQKENAPPVIRLCDMKTQRLDTTTPEMPARKTC